MVVQKDMVQTDVDSLVNLVKKKKEISFDDASAELSIPISTVESWANFLEEEGELSIFYKFTTPYLTSIDKNLEINKEILKKVEEHSSEIENMFTIFSSHLDKEDYPKVHQHTLKIHDKIKNLASTVSKDKDLSVLINPSLVLERLNVFYNVIKHTQSLKDKKDFERLRSAYNQIHSDLIEVFNIIKKGMENVNSFNQKDIKIKEEDISSKNSKSVNSEESEPIEIDFKINNTQDLDNVLKKIDKALASDDYETVRKFYIQLESFYNELPEKFKENRDTVKDTLLNLNKVLTNKLGDESLKKIELKSQEINSLAEVMRRNINEKNFVQAEKNYAKIEKLFLELPEGFLDIKISLENLIVDLHAELINVEKEIFVKGINEGKKNIFNLVENIEEALLNSNINLANLIYKDIFKEFQSLPEGFLEEKIILQKTISSIYQKLLLKEKELKESEFKEKMTKINIIYEEAESFVNSDDFEGAFSKLSEINNLFDSLPEGFIELKSEIENNILRLSKKVLILEKQHSTTKFQELKSRIDKLFLSARSYLSKKENDFAMEVYKEILSLYNMMPKGFMKDKSIIKTQILELYQTLLLDHGNDYEKSLTGSIRQKYEILLKLIVKVHEDIDLKKFDHLSDKYKKIVNLYNDLPIGFVQERVNLRHEILKIYDLINLYSKTKLLENKIEKKDFSGVKKLFDTILVLYQELYEHCKEDFELFSYVKERYDFFYSHYGHNLDEKPKNMEPIIENHEIINNMNSKNNELNIDLSIDKKKDEYFIDEYIKMNECNKIFDIAVNHFLKKDFHGSFSYLKKLSKIDPLNDKYDSLIGIIIKIESKNFLPENESGYFFSAVEYLYKNGSIEAKLSFTKLIRAVYNLLDDNLNDALNDLKKVVTMFPNHSNLLHIYRYAEYVKSKRLNNLTKMKVDENA